jgi:hypothetical protein
MIDALAVVLISRVIVCLETEATIARLSHELEARRSKQPQLKADVAAARARADSQNKKLAELVRAEAYFTGEFELCSNCRCLL